MLDEIVRNQECFRNLLQALSYPGRIYRIEKAKPYRGGLFPETMEMAMALVDGEVNLFIQGDYKEAFEEISIRTNTKEAAIEEADYIIIPLKETENIGSCIRLGKRGSLINPHTNATYIIEVEELKEEGDWIFRGPGIEDYVSAEIPYSETWIDKRQEAVSSFPMGVDIFLIDRQQNLLALPRTTRIERKGD